MSLILWQTKRTGLAGKKYITFVTDLNITKDILNFSSTGIRSRKVSTNLSFDHNFPSENYIFILKNQDDFKSKFELIRQTKRQKSILIFKARWYRVRCVLFNVSYVMEFLAWWVLKSKFLLKNKLYSNEIAVFFKLT